MEYYSKNKRNHKRNYRRYDRNRRENIKQKLFNYLSENLCVDCGESDPVVLEFDHVTGEKYMDISYMVQRGLGWKRIMGEIEKCQVRCANCHRRKTAAEFGWFVHNAQIKNKDEKIEE